MKSAYLGVEVVDLLEVVQHGGQRSGVVFGDAERVADHPQILETLAPPQVLELRQLRDGVVGDRQHLQMLQVLHLLETRDAVVVRVELGQTRRFLQASQTLKVVVANVQKFERVQVTQMSERRETAVVESQHDDVLMGDQI